MADEGSPRAARSISELRVEGRVPFAPEAAAPATPKAVDPDEVTLVEACRRGDRRAFDTLYVRHQPQVLAMALRRGCPPGEAEDVVHEVFMTLWRRPPQLEAAKLSTWMYRATANQVASLHRRRRVREAFAVALGRPSSDTGMTGEIESKDLVAAVLGRMSAPKREVLVLHELEGMTGPEIAEMVGCRVNTVWTRLHYARIEFRKWVERLRAEEGEAS